MSRRSFSHNEWTYKSVDPHYKPSAKIRRKMTNLLPSSDESEEEDDREILQPAQIISQLENVDDETERRREQRFLEENEELQEVAENNDRDSGASSNTSTSDEEENLLEEIDTDIFQQLGDTANALRLFEPIYEGADFSLLESLINVTRFYKKHNIPKSALHDLLVLLGQFTPNTTIFPLTKYKYMELVKKLAPLGEKPKIIHVCGLCKHEIGEVEIKPCPKCNDTEKNCVFVLNDIESIFRHMLELRGLSFLIEQENSKRKDPDTIYDVSDAGLAKRIEKQSPYDIICCENTDGFPYANSNNKQVWPNFLAICSIPHSLRCKFMVLASLWFSPVKPNIMKYLIPFAEKMRQLGSDGFCWTHPVSKEKITSRVFIVATALDAQARAPVMNMNYYNAEFGCPYCEVECPSIVVKKGHARVYPYFKVINKKKVRIEPVLRTRESVINQAQCLVSPEEKEKRAEAGITQPEHIKGIKGFSPFCLLPNFDIVNGHSPDILHSCFVGVCKRWIKFIINSKNSEKSFYIGTKLKNVNLRIDKLKVPAFINRLPRNLSHLAHWKASEFRNWLFFYSLPCLKNILPAKFFDHHCLLVSAIYMLCKSEVPIRNLNLAKTLLKKYCSQYGLNNFYGPEEETFNLHMLLHYASSVENIGPLWATSTFLFENANGLMRTSIHGTMHVAKELVNTSTIHNFLNTLEHINEIGQYKRGNHIQFLGSAKKLSEISDVTTRQYIDGLAVIFKRDITDLRLHSRLKIKGLVYTTESYSQANKTCSFYVKFKPQSAYNTIKALHFVALGDLKLIVGRQVVLEGAMFVTKSGEEVEHLQKFKETPILVHDVIENIKCPVIKILDDILAEPPNVHELNL